MRVVGGRFVDRRDTPVEEVVRFLRSRSPADSIVTTHDLGGAESPGVLQYLEWLGARRLDGSTLRRWIEEVGSPPALDRSISGLRLWAPLAAGPQFAARRREAETWSRDQATVVDPVAYRDALEEELRDPVRWTDPASEARRAGLAAGFLEISLALASGQREAVGAVIARIDRLRESGATDEVARFLAVSLEKSAARIPGRSSAEERESVPSSGSIEGAAARLGRALLDREGEASARLRSERRQAMQEVRSSRLGTSTDLTRAASWLHRALETAGRIADPGSDRLGGEIAREEKFDYETVHGQIAEVLAALERAIGEGR